MKKTDILKGLSCLLVISSLCFFLAACGVDGSGDVQNGVTDNSAYNTINSGERQSGVIDNPANSFDSNGVDESGETQPNIMDNPAYNPGDRQVLAVGITWLRRETLDRILAFNERNPSYFIEIKSYYNGLDTEAAKKLDTQLSLDILSGEGPDLMIWDNSFYTPALVSGKLMVNLHDLMKQL